MGQEQIPQTLVLRLCPQFVKPRRRLPKIVLIQCPGIPVMLTRVYMSLHKRLQLRVDERHFFVDFKSHTHKPQFL